MGARVFRGARGTTFPDHILFLPLGVECRGEAQEENGLLPVGSGEAGGLCACVPATRRRQELSVSRKASSSRAPSARDIAVRTEARCANRHHPSPTPSQPVHQPEFLRRGRGRAYRGSQTVRLSSARVGCVEVCEKLCVPQCSVGMVVRATARACRWRPSVVTVGIGVYMFENPLCIFFPPSPLPMPLLSSHLPVPCTLDPLWSNFLL